MENKDNLLAVDEDMINEVSKINKLISDEKEKQNAETLQNGQKKKIDTKNNSNVEKNTLKNQKGINRAQKSINALVDETIVTMERLHLRTLNDTIDVLYRPNHSYIAFLPNDENGRAEVKRIAEMSREEFDKYLDLSICFKKPTKKAVSEIRNTSLETWYKGAWSLNTKVLLKELGVENPIEEPLYEK